MAPDFDVPVLIGGVKKQFRLSERRGKQNRGAGVLSRELGPGQHPADGHLPGGAGKIQRAPGRSGGISVDHIMNTTSWEREIGPFDFLWAAISGPTDEVSRDYGVLREADLSREPANVPSL